MDKNSIKTLGKCIFGGMIWSVIFIVLALLITQFKDYNLKDVLFIEGIFLVMLGAFSSLSGNPLGLNLPPVTKSTEFITSEVLKNEELRKERNIKNKLRMGLNMVSLIISGVICIITNFII